MKIELGYNSTYPIKGYGSIYFNLDQGKTISVQEVVYVPSLKKNLIFIFSFEGKGMKVAFVNGKFLTWPMRSSIRDAFTLGFRFEDIYKINGRPIHALIHGSNYQCELWHRRFAHLHYKDFPPVRKMVFGMLEIRVDQDGVCQGCEIGKHVKGPFYSSKSKTSLILHVIHSDLCGPMPVNYLDG